ncbi:hypothetical protein HG530_010196 [Fusarium avenaceum]|nr:hypothetical protein HG530_010196 [Fusarium avenaceum]
MDGNMDTIVLVAGACELVGLTERCWVRVTILLLLQGKEIVCGNSAERIISARNLLGFNDGSDRDLLRLNQRGGRNGVVAGLELGKTLNEGGEGDRGPLLTLTDGVEETGNVVVVRAGLLVEVILVATEAVHLGLDIVVGGECSEGRDELTGNRGTDLEVVSQNSIVCCRVGERDLGGRLESLDGDDTVLLTREIKNVKESLNLLTRVGGPDSNVISSLVLEVRTADVDFHVETVSVLGREQFVGLGDGGNVRVVRVEGSLGGAFEMQLVGFTEVDFIGLRGKVVALVDGEDGLINGFTLFQSHLLSKGLPHGILPGQEILFHCTSSIVTFTGFADAVSTKLFKGLVNVADHRVVVFVSVVSETESDKVEVIQSRIVALVEAGILAGDELVEINCVIGRLTFTVSCENEHDDVVARNSIQVIEIVVFKVGNHSVESKATLTLLGETRGIIFSSTSLRTVEDDAVLARFLHCLNDVSRAPRLRNAAGSEAVGIRVLGNTP